MDKQKARKCVRDRTKRLNSNVWDCEACGTSESMEIRRSSLNEKFYADDVMFKCMAGKDGGGDECWNTRAHGIPFDSPDQFEHELQELRGRERVLDFAEEGPEKSVRENLEALGYVGKSKTE